MVRQPTDSELAHINKHFAQKPLSVDDIYVLDASVANDVMVTSYHYYLGTTTLANFVNDLNNSNDPIKMLVNHGGGFLGDGQLPIGTWISGRLEKIDGGHSVQAPVFMIKGLKLGEYHTDEVVKAYNAGHLTDVSITWEDRDNKVEIVCDMCGLDIRDSECEHIPGLEYEGEIATCTIENAHLGGEISAVWKGALPGAKFRKPRLSYKSDKGQRAYSWKSIKQAGKGMLSHTLTMPISHNHNAENSEEESMKTYEDFKNKFSKEIGDEFVLKVDHDSTVQELSTVKEGNATMEADLTDVRGKLTDLTTEHNELTEKFANLNVKVNEDEPFVEIGKTALQEMVTEYHRLSVALHGDTHDEEASNAQLEAMPHKDRFEFLVAESKKLSEELKKKIKTDGDNLDPDGKKPWEHMDSDTLYKSGT